MLPIMRPVLEPWLPIEPMPPALDVSLVGVVFESVGAWLWSEFMFIFWLFMKEVACWENLLKSMMFGFVDQISDLSCRLVIEVKV